jgi:LysR family nitrogen assimilation transcriptional regulator
MEFRNLELFLSVAATGSFSRAATLAGSTQSSVSKGIAALEAELSTRLFDRTGRGVTLTAAGRALLDRAEALVGEIRTLPDLLAEHGAPPTGLVRLGIQPSASWPLVREVLGAAADRLPQVRLLVSEGTTQQIEQWLVEGRCDLAVLSRMPPAAYAESRLLFSVALEVVGRAGAADLAGGAVPFSQLARLPLVMASVPNGGRLLLEEQARRRGLHLNVVQEINSFHLTKRLIEAGTRYTVASRPSVEAEIRAGLLSAAPIVRPGIRQTFHLAVAGRRQAPAAVRRVADLVLEQVARLPDVEMLEAGGRSVPGG